MKTGTLESVKRILVYKRVHNGDPDDRGVFGCNNCMVRVRGSAYDAVIGIGGISGEPQKYRIARTISWIGIGPKRIESSSKTVPEITFEHFLAFHEAGWFPKDKDHDAGQRFFIHAPSSPAWIHKAPRLAHMFYEQRYQPRFRILKRGVDNEFVDAKAILCMAVTAAPSRGRVALLNEPISNCKPKSRLDAAGSCR